MLNRHHWEQRINRMWYGESRWASSLAPLSALFGAVSRRRRLRQQQQAGNNKVPVVVVGNITVGGSGKTPTVLAIVNYLREQGWQPGIISRGYGARPGQFPFLVQADSTAREAGDEPLLMAQRSGCPVVISPDRQQAVAALLTAHPQTSIIVADDGLQHYRLARDIEIVVIDGERGLGNGRLLPAGPLREPAERLQEVDLVVVNGGLADTFGGYPLTLQVEPLAPVVNEGHPSISGPSVNSLSKPSQPPKPPKPPASVHAVAAIGNPQRFFNTLMKQGFQPVPHTFADHHQYRAADLQFDQPLAVVMTEKDAVKCRGLNPPNSWYLPVTANLPDNFWQQFQQRLDRLH